MVDDLLSQFNQQMISGSGAIPNTLFAAFERSWATLGESSQQVGIVLSLFGAAPIPEALLLQTVQSEAGDQWQVDALRSACAELIERHLLKAPEANGYVLPNILRVCLRKKLNSSTDGDLLKRGYCREMVAIARQIPDAAPTDKAPAVVPDLPSVLMAAAVPHIAEAASAWREWLPDEHLGEPFAGLGRFYRSQRAYEEALSWYQDGLAVARDRLSDDHPAVADSLNDLADFYFSQGRYEVAENLFLQVLERRQRLFGPEHPAIAESLNNLGLVYYTQEHYPVSEPLYVEALEMRQKLLGQDHPDIALSLNNLAGLYFAQGRYAEAEPLIIQALEMRRRLLGEDSTAVALSLHNLAMLYDTQKRYEAAEPLYVQALAVAERQLGKEHPNTVLYRGNLESVRARMRSPFAWLHRWMRPLRRSFQ